jgi:hypothetical protein
MWCSRVLVELGATAPAQPVLLHSALYVGPYHGRHGACVLRVIDGPMQRSPCLFWTFISVAKLRTGPACV